MADFSIWMIGESQISLSGGTQLDGVTQGDGSHLQGQTLTINQGASTQVQISDGGSDTAFADNDGDQRLDGATNIDGVTYGSGTRIEAEYEFTLLDEATGEEYRVLAVNFVTSDGLPSYGSIEGLAFVDEDPPLGTPLRVISTSEGPGNSGGSAVDGSETVPVCICAGTHVMTDQGERLVEDLRIGDLLQTYDGAFVPLRAVLSSEFSGGDLTANPKLYPVRIVAGALGQGLPKRDLLVSRQHRMLVASDIVSNQLGAGRALISAIKLSCLPGIFVDPSVPLVSYYHLVLEDHSIIVAEGSPTESLLLGPEALAMLDPDGLEELQAIFPELDFDLMLPAAMIPTAKMQNKIARLHHAARRPLLA